MKFKGIFFDLDGTIVNSSEGITNGVKYALSHFGIEEDNLSVLHSFIGPPLYDSFIKNYGFNQEDTYTAIKKYREFYNVTGVHQNSLIEGIEEFLQKLEADGYKIYLATSKPLKMARVVLADFNLTKYFIDTFGTLEGEDRIQKDTIVSRVLNASGLKAEECLMVGDRLHDIHGAHNCGVKAVGVTLGFGDREEFINAGADFIVDSYKELYEVLNEEE